MPIRALIVDDEPLAREKLRGLLEQEQDLEILEECADGREAVEAIERHRPDLVFLDVQMPELDGFEVLSTVAREGMNIPTLVFVTAYDRYALRAFEVNALDYLLKPFDRRRLQDALGRARVQMQRQESNGLSEELVALLDHLKGERQRKERIVVKEGGRVFFLRKEEIDWVEAAGNYVRLHVGDESHLLRETMSAMEGSLDPDRFLRIHRSTIVNIERIKQLETTSSGEYVVILRDESRHSLSRRYRERVHRVLGDFS